MGYGHHRKNRSGSLCFFIYVQRNYAMFIDDLRDVPNTHYNITYEDKN